ncbi:Tetratricopeptide repeat-containing protein [Desulfatibacillum alkenivorans DSM 16219]|uniref:Tetratricopeptide repeat-containing protein n=1 Tax=Desulfatibacillum alkenivorans DSM 16219 TaxID=1121393 RepID=A0A1M6ZS22_9BACT|nr:Tetratricopeptide repeat-containing protein [Desulfatibacillum alkenivorans DSM 16219]
MILVHKHLNLLLGVQEALLVMPEILVKLKKTAARCLLAAVICVWTASCASAPGKDGSIPGASYFERALFAESKGRHLAAIEQYTRYLELNQNAPEYAAPALNNRGTLYWTLGRYDEALQDFDQAVDMLPDSALNYINRGNVYADMGDVERAIEDYSQAITVDPKNGLAYSNRGLAWSSLKRFDQAIPDLDKAIELGHEDLYKSLMKRGVIRFGTKDYNGAVEDFSHVIGMHPGFIEAYYFRGLAHQQLNEAEKAQIDLQTAMDLQKALEKQ